ncbi:ParB/RepB/Spo0J family partition protein [Indioceanicola profundi]|uniref:ParB/RepB/Spo0J family partition protein n=1 Tax=Indioceanicola profundi TaxID=2220096 RepID=UPI000E6AC0C2|nr:ParB/RepB/Spo0J family partition protein [Indioceanicola profundi]
MVSFKKTAGAKTAGSAGANPALRSRSSVDEMFGIKGVARLFQANLTHLHPRRDQPRRHFDEAEMMELADSLKSVGQIHPVIVRPHPDISGQWEIVAGERRWRAANMAGWSEILALVTEGDPDEIALVENLQRADLNPIEEAAGIERLIDKHGWTQEAAAQSLSKPRVWVNMTLRLLSLPDAIKQECGAFHKVVPRNTLLEIARLDDEEEQIRLWAKAKTGQLTVRDAKASRIKPQVQQESRPLELVTFLRGLGRVEKSVAGAVKHGTDLRPEERRRLETLKQQIDQMLQQS